MDFKTRTKYNFEVYPSNLIGTNFKGVTVASRLDPEEASREIDIIARHAQYYPTLPAGTPDDPKSYDYLKIRFLDGSVAVIGIAWIDISTVEEVSSQTVTVKISSVSAGDLSRIKDALLSNGFSDLDITID